MAFTRDELERYEKAPQTKVSDKVNPFRGATPAKVADPAAVAAVAAGQTDATPGGAPQRAQAEESLVDDSPVVDEDGTLGDPTDSGEGTSDVNSEDSSDSAVDPSDETDLTEDLTGEQPTDEEETARPAPKKGSAAERIVEVLDLAEGYKEFGQHMQDQLKEALAENQRLRGGGTPTTTAATVVPPVVEEESMPDMADEDVAFDNDKYRAKMQKWVDKRTDAAAERAIRRVTGQDAAQKVRTEVEAKVTAFAKTKPDFEKVVTKNPVLSNPQNQLAPDAGFAVAQSEYTAELLYAFGSDPGMAIRVARQSPAQQLVTVGKMIAKIEAEKEQGAAPNKGKGTPQAGAQPAAKKSITQAPPPPRATPAGGRAQARDPLDPNTPMEDFARQHRAGKQNTREANRKQRGLN